MEINFQPKTYDEMEVSFFAWLDFCLDKLNEGKDKEIPFDPFYKSKRRKMTDEYIDRVIEALDEEFYNESVRYPDFHQSKSGSATPPEFSRLSPRGRRSLVQGLDRLMSV